MGFWKILGGIAAGVGAVALLPVAGAVGAVTATGAIVGGTLGAAVAASSEDEKKRLRTENERIAATAAVSVNQAKEAVVKANEKVVEARNLAQEANQRAVEAEKSLEAARATMERYRESFKDVESHYQLVIALTAIGMAAAYADGSVDASETEEMDEYVSGIAAAKLPAKVKARIQYLHNHPPTFEEAMAEIAKLDREGLPVDAFRQLIVDVINADGVVEVKEELFLKKWDETVTNGMVLATVAEPADKKVNKAVVAKKPAAKGGEAKKAVAKKTTAKKVTTKKATAKKATAKKATTKKATVKKTTAKKATTKKKAAKK